MDECTVSTITNVGALLFMVWAAIQIFGITIHLTVATSARTHLDHVAIWGLMLVAAKLSVDPEYLTGVTFVLTIVMIWRICAVIEGQIT